MPVESSPDAGPYLLELAIDRRSALRGAGGMLGALLLSSALAGPLAADVGYAPFFQRLGEIMIPTTSTPGAGTTEVFAFVSRAVEKGILGAPADLMARLKADVDARAGGDFLARPKAAQQALIAALDTESYRPGAPGDSPWVTAKTLMLVGYYTSEAGGSQELDYELVPGRYDADIPIKPGHQALSNDWSGLSIRKGAMKI